MFRRVSVLVAGRLSAAQNENACMELKTREVESRRPLGRDPSCVVTKANVHCFSCLSSASALVMFMVAVQAIKSELCPVLPGFPPAS
jgi:hypothetical protein